MPYEEILKMPYCTFILGMLDAPHIDYEAKKDKKKIAETADEEINAITSAFL